MNVNATIIVQAVHFLFAYFVISRFLLRPVTAVIFRERAYQKQLEDAIENEKQVCVHKQEQQKNQWDMFQREWLKHVPLFRGYVKKEQPELGIKKISLKRDVLQDEAQRMAAHIKKRVDYAK